jgi:hypothetical protein
VFNHRAFSFSAALAAISILCVASPALAQMDIGALRVILPGVSTDSTTARVRTAAITRLRAVDSTVRPILPGGARFDVSVEKCGRPEYLYDRSQRRVVLCTEMDGFARALVRASGGDSKDALDRFAIFAILHEVGHAAIDQLRLPIAGNMEDAADGFAAYALLARGENGTVLAAAQWLAWLDMHLSSTSVDLSQDYAGDHPLPSQRYDRLRCLVEGKTRLPSATSESTNRPDCQREWLRLSADWQHLLREAPSR